MSSRAHYCGYVGKEPGSNTEQWGEYKDRRCEVDEMSDSVNFFARFEVDYVGF